MRPVFFYLFFYLQPDRPRLLPSPSQPAPILPSQTSVTLVPILCPNSNIRVYPCVSLCLSVICFLPFSHLHLVCTLEQKQNCSKQHDRNKTESIITSSPTRFGVDRCEKPAEAILYQGHDGVKGSCAHTDCCQKLYYIIYMYIRSTSHDVSPLHISFN